MKRLEGLIAATYTPMHQDGTLNLDTIPRMVDRLIDDGVAGLYVCGSTGEGMSLTGDERRAVAEAFVEATRRRLPVIVQVGHNSVTEAAELAAHAQQIGADVISATAPGYYKIDTTDMLANCMATIASAAVDLPFYYYHIPALTGVALDMVTFLKQASRRIDNLAGMKYTCPTAHEYQACRELDGGRFDILWGTDEMLLSGLVVGVRGAVGTTYNMAAPLYRGIMNAFESGDLELAEQRQYQSVQMIRVFAEFPFLPAMKEVMNLIGIDCGPCRPPLGRLTPEDSDRLRDGLDRIGFFDWGRRV